MNRKPRRRRSTISSTHAVGGRAGADAGRRCARPSRTNSASGSRAPSAPTPTCSCPRAADPSARGRKSSPSMRPPVVAPAGACPPTQSRSDIGPDVIAVAVDHRMRAAKVARLVRVERGVNAAVHDHARPPRAPPCRPRSRAAHCRCECRCRRCRPRLMVDEVERFERFVHDDRRAVRARRGRRPARRASGA